MKIHLNLNVQYFQQILEQRVVHTFREHEENLPISFLSLKIQ